MALTHEEARKLLSKLSGWEINGGGHLYKRYRFGDFASALAFVNRVGAIAEERGHHPDIGLGWGRVELELWTHDAGGLTDKDFTLAAAADAALSG